MKKFFVFLFSLFLFSLLQAQYKVRFILKEKSAIRHDSIYIVGTFSNWDSTPNIKYLLRPYGVDEKSIVLDLKGNIRYKFHRGSWLKVEKRFYGDEVSDRILNITKDTVLIDSVSAWRDQVIADKMVLLQQQKTDTNRLSVLAAIATGYAFFPEFYNADSALYYAQTALQLHQKIKSSEEYKTWSESGNTAEVFRLQEILAVLLHSLGNYPKSLEIRFENLKLVEKETDKHLLLQAIRNVASDYSAMKDYLNALKYGKMDDSILSTISVADRDIYKEEYFAKELIASSFFYMNQPDSALYYARKIIGIKMPDGVFQMGANAFNSKLLGDIYLAKKQYDTAFSYYNNAIENASQTYLQQVIAGSVAGKARVFHQKGMNDSALYYAKQAINYFKSNTANIQAWGENTDTYIADISPLLADLYMANHQPDSAYKYLRLSITLKDSLYNTDKVRQFQTLSFNESARREQLEQQIKEAQQQFATKIKMYGLVTVTLAVLTVAFILYRNNKQKQNANTILQTQKQEIETTLKELKITQSQLIQSEKMASLGELTAGIAHEIQNPLNFVNNFSEVNKELLVEMKNEIDKGNFNEVKTIANDVIDNQEKINHHGKRADAIVKGMLQHSRSSSSVKEPTDINALVDEYLRLAYHGLRAKDNSFNATMKTDFDKSVGNVNIIPQDIGRVVLNLITNAFYEVGKKKKQLGSLPGGQAGYEPTVIVTTKKANGNVEVHVKDNGNGIPQNIVEKIFQPFFTTKPTGQGTGLGLSLSYDIIKTHGGELKVDSKEGEGAEFIILLPTS
ncbi:MAG: ATP-binding protein [Bacteroidota bacterium]